MNIRITAACVLLAAMPALADTAPTASQVRIVVPAHDIPRGGLIADTDLTYRDIGASPIPIGIAFTMDQLDGMQTRRFLRAAEPVRLDDVRQPILVTKGSNVTMIFTDPGITLIATGKAMTEGGIGDTITVLNPVSYRQIPAVVTGSGQVRVGDTTPVLMPQQIAGN